MAAIYPNVAVLIAAKNAQTTIKRAVRSALSQPQAAEVLVVDDGSDDCTAQAAASCEDGTSRLRIIRQPNRGPAAARNTAIRLSRAPFLCVLDADDFFLPGRLTEIFDGLGEDWDLAADKLLLGQENAEDGPFERWRGDEALPSLLDFAQFVEGNISRPERPRTELGYLKPLIRRAFLERHDLKFNEELWLGEDYLLYAEALARGARFRTAKTYGYVAISRPTSLSHQHPPERLEALLRADEALEALTLSVVERRALRLHQADLRRKWLYRLALDAKKRGHFTRAAALTMSRLDVFAYVFHETLRSYAQRVQLNRLRTQERAAYKQPSPVI